MELAPVPFVGGGALSSGTEDEPEINTLFDASFETVDREFFLFSKGW